MNHSFWPNMIIPSDKQQEHDINIYFNE